MNFFRLTKLGEKILVVDEIGRAVKLLRRKEGIRFIQQNDHFAFITLPYVLVPFFSAISTIKTPGDKPSPP